MQAEKVAPPPPPLSKAPDGQGKTDIQLVREKILKHRERFTGKKTLPTIEGVQALSMMTRYLDGGRDRFLELAQNAMAAGHDVAERWMFVFADLTPIQRTRVNFDDVCAGAGVSPLDLVKSMLETEWTYSRDVADIIRVAALPKMMGKLVESGLQLNGKNPEVSERDRARFLQSANMIPTPKGTTIQIAANAQAAASAAMDPSVPSFRDDMEALSATTRAVQRAIAGEVE